MTARMAAALAMLAIVAHTALNVTLIQVGATDQRWIAVQVAATILTMAAVVYYYRVR